MTWQKSLSFLEHVGLFRSPLDIGSNPAALKTAGGHDLIICGNVLSRLPFADAARLINTILVSGAKYLMANNPNAFLCKTPFYFRVPLWRIYDTYGAPCDIWRIEDLRRFAEDDIAHPPTHNPYTTEDLQHYAFFRALCALPFVKKINLYGSRALGKPKPDSDLDMMLYCNPSPTREEWLRVCDIIDGADLPLEIDCKWDDGQLNSIFDAPDYVASCMRTVYMKEGNDA